jgi:sRNA-binding carbon storage regulator CsrA
MQFLHGVVCKMLVLGRKLHEKIIINGELIITITQLTQDNKMIKLSFEDPNKKYVIDRMEVHHKKLKGKKPDDVESTL